MMTNPGRGGMLFEDYCQFNIRHNSLDRLKTRYFMSLTPISTITLFIEQQPGWEGVRDWGLIVRAWENIVSPAIASRSRPKSLSRGILSIATNSASLAHQLTFGRQALCQQLNSQLLTPVLDLRFAAVGYLSPTIPSAVEDRSIPIDSGEIVICSHCDCRSRQGEILRWGVCQFCAIDLGILGGRSFK
jgi:predicted nucleic acid-binding Zn ribbon protein